MKATAQHRPTRTLTALVHRGLLLLALTLTGGAASAQTACTTYRAPQLGPPLDNQVTGGVYIIKDPLYVQGGPVPCQALWVSGDKTFTVTDTNNYCADFVGKFNAQSGTQFKVDSAAGADKCANGLNPFVGSSCVASASSGSFYLVAGAKPQQYYCPTAATCTLDDGSTACAVDDGPAAPLSCTLDNGPFPPPTVADPINTTNGNNFQIITDYRGPGSFPLEFTRYYNSLNERGEPRLYRQPPATATGTFAPVSGRLVMGIAQYTKNWVPIGDANAIKQPHTAYAYVDRSSCQEGNLASSGGTCTPRPTTDTQKTPAELIDNEAAWRHTYQRALKWVAQLGTDPKKPDYGFPLEAGTDINKPFAKLRVELRRHDGNLLTYSADAILSQPNTTLLSGPKHIAGQLLYDRLQPCPGTAGKICPFRYDDVQGQSEWYDYSGKFMAWRDSAGGLQVLSYADKYQSLAGDNKLFRQCLKAVTNGTQTLTFECDANGFVSRLVLPGGNDIRYQWADGTLKKVCYPTPNSTPSTAACPADYAVREYLYNSREFPWALEGIKDERGLQTHVWQYNAQGLANQASRGGKEQVDLTYSVSDVSATLKRVDQVRITTGSGAVAEMRFLPSRHTKTPYVTQAKWWASADTTQVPKLLSEQFLDESAALSGLQYYRFLDVTDSRGVQEKYIMDEATGRARTVSLVGRSSHSLEYFDNSTLPKTVSTSFATGGSATQTLKWLTPTGDNYNPMPGNSSGTLGSAADTLQATQSFDVNGKSLALTSTVKFNPISANGGKTLQIDNITSVTSDVGAPTSSRIGFSYDQNRVASVTLAGNRTLSFVYDTANWIDAPICIRSWDGLRVQRKYHPRGWLLQQTVSRGDCATAPAPHDPQWVTQYAYYANGQLESVVAPDGSVTRFGFDAAGRLEHITDPLGNVLAPQYDNMARVTAVSRRDLSGREYAQREVVFDSLGRPAQEKSNGAISAQVSAYRKRPNPTSQMVAPNAETPDIETVSRASGTLTYAYDATARVSGIKQHEPGGTLAFWVELAYSGWDALTEVKTHLSEADSVKTQYTPTPLGLTTAEKSPDYGDWTSTATNVFGQATAGTTPYGGFSAVYDDLGRLSSYTVAGTDGKTDGLKLDYGACPGNSCDRLTQASRSGTSSTVTTWSHDLLGRIETRTENNLKVSYVYGNQATNNGRLTGITLPSGNRVRYEWANGVNVGVSVDVTTGSGTTAKTTNTPLIVYSVLEPFAGPLGWLWGNGRYHLRLPDSLGRPDTLYAQDLIGKLTWDDADRITGIGGNGTAGFITGKDCTGTFNYAYDAADRLTQDCGTLLPAYDLNGNRKGSTATLTSNRLAAASHNAAGDITAIGNLGLSYDNLGRVTSATKDGKTSTYRYNALHERIEKTINNQTTRFIYSEGGQLLGEYDSANNPLKEYVWYYGLPVAVVDYQQTGPKIYLIDTDHLGTPRRATDYTSKSEVWRWQSDAFGNGDAVASPKPGEGAATINLRFPGQYLDAETGLHYNYFRYYSPEQKRYLQPDPIGLAGGPNPFAYVGNNPLGASDALGLSSWLDRTLGAVRAVGGAFEVAAGVGLGSATSWTGAGAVAGGLVVLHGVDQIQTGTREFWNGHGFDSYTSVVLQSAGVSRGNANLTDACVGFVGSLGSGIAATSIKISKIRATDPLAQNMKAMDILNKTDIGSKALNTADFNALGGYGTSPLAKARMIESGVNNSGAPYALTTTRYENLVKSFELAGTGPTPSVNLFFGISGAGVNAGVGGIGFSKK